MNMQLFDNIRSQALHSLHKLNLSYISHGDISSL